jgi:uncharacterized protein (TIGR00369 family)
MTKRLGTEEFMEKLQEFMEHGIPFNEFLGMKVTLIDNGRAEMKIPGRPELTGDPFRPALHGGVISSLADTVGGLAVFSTVEPGRVASTVDLRVDYLRPGNVDIDLYAQARVLRVGNRVAATHTVVYQTTIDEPIATASAVYNLVTWKKFPPDEQVGS